MTHSTPIFFFRGAYVARLLGACLLLWAFAASAQVAMVGSFQVSRSNAGLLTMTLPSGVQTGDLMVVQIASQVGAAVTANTPASGWGLLSDDTNNTIRQQVYYQFVGSVVLTDVRFDIGAAGTNESAGSLVVLRGADPGGPFCSDQASLANSATISAPASGTACGLGAMQVAFFSINRAANLTVNEGTALFVHNNGVSHAASYQSLTSGGSGTTMTVSSNRSTRNIGTSVFVTSVPLTCLSDNFNRTSGLGGDWAAARVSGGFDPAIVGNRLRLTDTGGNESTAVSFQRLFPGANNFVQMEFTYYGYGGSGADGIAVILSDSAITPQPGGFGGSLGYAPKGAAPGFSGGWLGVGLDEYGNFSNQNDSGPCAPGVPSCATGRIVQSVAIRGSANNYYWLTGTPTLSPTVSNSTGHKYRVSIDSRVAGQALVSVDRDTTGTGASYTPLIASFNAAVASGQAAIPANLVLSITGSTGGSTNNHEIDDLQICAQTVNPMTPQIDHYRLAVSTTALTCTPAAVTVTACMDSACTTTYSGNVSATLLPTGWVGGDTQTFAGSGASLGLSKTTAGSYTLGVSSSNPPIKAFSQTLCSINGGAYSTNCALTFANAGLLYSVPAQTSGVTSAPITITAAKTDDITKKCVPAFTGSRNVKFWSGYVNPATGTLPLAVNGSNIATASPGTSLALNFDANAQAMVTLNYPDAGQVSLNARYDGSVATADNGLVMTGSSTFAVKPYALCVDSPDANWNCAATPVAAQNPANCGVFRAAGNSFNLRVTGKAASGAITDACALPTTPNYQQNGLVLGSAVVAPSGGQNGALSAASVNITAGGTATVSVSESEVGVFGLSATPPSTAYFGLTVPAGSSNFGRFTPAGFNASGTLNNRSDLTCSPAAGFTYLSEPVGAAVALSAVNAAGAVTQNYTGSYARLNLATVLSAGSNGLAFGVQSGATLLNTRLSSSCTSCPAFSNGATTLAAALTVLRASGIPADGPFDGANAARFGLVATDADAIGMRAPNFNWDLVGGNEGILLGSSNLYFGRLRVENRYGSPVLPLSVPVYAEVWNGTSFVKQVADNCTTLTVPSASTITSATAQAMYCNAAGGVGLYGTLSGVSAKIGSQLPGATATLNAGAGDVVLSKPSNSGGGYLDLALSVPSYLKYNWDGANSCAGATAPHDDNPRARIRFGTRRNDSIIYLREVY